MPSEAMWKRAAYLMQRVSPGARTGRHSFRRGQRASEAMVIYAVLYTVIALAVAVRGSTDGILASRVSTSFASNSAPHLAREQQRVIAILEPRGI